MAVSVNRNNTKLYKTQDGGWVRVVYHTGTLDPNGDPVTIEVRLSMASLEQSAGVLLPAARIKVILEAEIAKHIQSTDVPLRAYCDDGPDTLAG